MTLLQQDYLEPLLKYQKNRCFEEENSNETEYSYLRLLPDMSEGLIGLCMGDIMGILLSVDATRTLSLQQQQVLKTFIETLLRTSKSSLSIFKLSILYLYKLNKKIRDPSVLNAFKINLIEKDITSMEAMEQSELLFVVILMLAFKYTEDHCYYISAWSKATGIPSETIHKLEVIILNILDHNLFVSQERFESFSTRIIQKINKLKIDLLQSVKISYASSNYSSSSEEENNSCDPLRCRKCCCKRKQESIVMDSSAKKRRLVLSNLTNDATTRYCEADNASKFYTLPTTLYDYYKNRNNGVLMKQQPLTPPTPTQFTNSNTNSYNNNNNININNINNININTNIIKQNVPSINNTLLQVDSMIIPSTPPTSQTSIFEDLEREEEIKNSETNLNDEFEEEEEEDDDDDEDEVEDEVELTKTQPASRMAFILNPDENKIQLDCGENNIQKIHSEIKTYHYHNQSPTHHKSNYAYDNLKKVNLLNTKIEKSSRMAPSIVLPNTSPVADVASVFPSLSILSHKSYSNDSSPIEDTNNRNKSMGLKSLLSENTFKPSMNAFVIGNSEEDDKRSESLMKSDYITVHNDGTNNENSIISNTNCPYLNKFYSLSNDEIEKQKLLLSIYNCYAMRNIRHYQI
ncbi:hypothetical protein H8356DRAFT_1711817 [Neocallimastix lanati (nom. inval.)]|jgi:hypothetical protein|nr:hypothetical protein H8356DRAFT_1711817 [Neocallimastix sp. JGI-2020a]